MKIVTQQGTVFSCSSTNYRVSESTWTDVWCSFEISMPVSMRLSQTIIYPKEMPCCFEVTNTPWGCWFWMKTRIQSTSLFKIVFQVSVLFCLSFSHKRWAYPQGPIMVSHSLIWSVFATLPSWSFYLLLYSIDSKILVCLKIAREFIKMHIPNLHSLSITQRVCNGAQVSKFNSVLTDCNSMFCGMYPEKQCRGVLMSWGETSVPKVVGLS